jgi:phosphoribosylaminoimidazole-succinocarboxamide synthase
LSGQDYHRVFNFADTLRKDFRMTSPVVLQTSLPGLPVRRGKVRDVYDLGDQLLLVGTDRLSAFDWVLPTGIPDKGRVLTQISAFWFGLLGEPNHLVTTDVTRMPLPAGVDRAELEGRSTLCRKTQVVPIECVVRGYLAGSGWQEYQRSGTVCGIRLPAGLTESARLPEPIFTPSTKAETGHDENISFDEMVQRVGRDISEELRRRSLDVFRRGSEHALKAGIIIADTKFEWGRVGDEVILIDEVLTPDSSRFWPADQYASGRGQPSFDKQFVRDWLSASGWDKNSPPPALPDDVVSHTRAKYVEAYERLTGKRFG